MNGLKDRILAKLRLELLRRQDRLAEAHERPEAHRCMRHHAEDVERHRKCAKGRLHVRRSAFDIDERNSLHELSPVCGQAMNRPPFVSSETPLMYDASSDARNAIAPACSSGDESRLIGMKYS